MPPVFYNSLTKCEQEFTPLQGKRVTMYTCGPTVYGRPHIGNYSSFLMADLLRRWLEVSGYEVVHAKNITDVGHLVKDADTGEDKIEKQAREEFGGVSHDSVIKIARKYEAEYLADERALNLLEPTFRPRATEYIEEMKTMVEELLKTGHAYVTDDGVYFDVTSKTPTPYGTLSGNTLDNIASGARVEVREGKRHPADFALWKFCVGPNEHHALRWESPRGVSGEKYPDGFPGWHIECSAMSRKLLGDQIDIHTGGEDNIFPHHECEIAQSESVTGEKPFVGLWLHKRRIDLEGEKMSKSLGNVLTLSNIEKEGFNVMDLRYYLLSVHYRTNLKFSWKGMEDAHKSRRKICEWMEEISSGEKFGDAPADGAATRALDDVKNAMDDDLNVASALAAIFGLMTHSNGQKFLSVDDRKSYDDFIEKIRKIFGCFDPEKVEKISPKVQALLDERASARTSKNFAESDRIRSELLSLGYEVKDTSEGQKIRKL